MRDGQQRSSVGCGLHGRLGRMSMIFCALSRLPLLPLLISPPNVAWVVLSKGLLQKRHSIVCVVPMADIRCAKYHGRPLAQVVHFRCVGHGQHRVLVCDTWRGRVGATRKLWHRGGCHSSAPLDTPGRCAGLQRVRHIFGEVGEEPERALAAAGGGTASPPAPIAPERARTWRAGVPVARRATSLAVGFEVVAIARAGGLSVCVCV